MNFIEGFNLYTEVGSSGRGVLASQKGDPGTLGGVPVHVRRNTKDPVIGGGYWRR